MPLVRAAYDRWRALESRSGRRLLVETGVLLVGQPRSELLAGARTSAEEHGVPCEPLDARRARAALPDDRRRRRRCRAARAGRWRSSFPKLASKRSSRRPRPPARDLHFDEPLESWRRVGDSIEVTTARDRYVAGRLLLAAGAWMPALLPGLPLQVERQVLHWFEPPDARPFAPDALPVFLFEETGGHAVVRRSRSRQRAQGRAPSPRRGRQPRHPRSRRPRRRRRSRAPPAAPAHAGARTPRRAVRSVCMYTNTPDGHFLID